MVPEPFAVRLAVAALRLNPSDMLPLFAVVVSVVVPELASADAVVIALLSVTDKLVNVSPPEARLTAPVLTTVALPVVFRVRLGVAVLILPMLPEPVLIDTDVEPVTVPAPVIVPVPSAVNVTTVPLRAAPTTIGLFVAVVSINDSAPAVVIDPLVVMPPLAVSVKLNPPEPAVDVPLPVRAVVSVSVTAPAPPCVVVILGVAILPSVIFPVPLVSATDVVPVTVPADCVIVPVPFAVSVTAVPEADAPNATLPLLALVTNDRVPDAVIPPEVVRAALFETDTALPVDVPAPIFSAAPPVPAHVTLPVVLNVRFDVVPVSVVMAPEPEVRFKFVVVIDPPLCPIVPEPFAVKLAVAALRLNPSDMLPLFAVVVSAVVPELVSAEAVVMELSLLTDKLVNVSPPEARLTAPVLTTVALPVVFSVRLGVAVLIEPMLPEPVLIATDVEPVTVPEPVIVPVPSAVSVPTVPLRAAPTTTGLLVAVVSINDSAPAVVIDPLVVMPPLAVSVKLNPPEPAVDVPLPVRAVASVSVTAPAPP